MKSTEMSDWQQIPNLEDKLDGDTIPTKNCKQWSRFEGVGDDLSF